MNQEELSLIYVWDAYCGWCYGFSKSLKAFHEKHPELSLTILPGGLFMGERKQAMGSLPYIADANERIHQLTGAIFGEAYQDLAQEGTFVMDSEAAAKGFVALTYFSKERAYELSAAMQHAFYSEGKSLNDAATYAEIAERYGLDSEAVVEKFEDASSTKEAHEKFIQVQQLGIQSYPTLLLKKGEQLFELGGGVMTPEKIEARLMKILSA